VPTSSKESASRGAAGLNVARRGSAATVPAFRLRELRRDRSARQSPARSILRIRRVRSVIVQIDRSKCSGSAPHRRLSLPNRIRILGGLLLAAIAVSAPAVASVNRSPKPGGVYQLKPGVYVQNGVSCASAPNAAIRQYDGRGIGDAHSRACSARVLVRKGNRYTVEQSCIDAGAGPAPRVSQRQTVTVSDALTFTVRTRGPGTTYRYCPASMLPADLEGRVN